jgi:hypothetical protein
VRTQLAPYPVGPTGKDASPVAASANGTTGAVSAVLPAGGANVLTYISGFEATFSTPTAAVTITVTVATLTGSVTLNYTVQSLAAGAAVQPPAPLVVEFNPPIPANALNSAITVSVPALGAGAPGVSVAAHGYQVPMSS